MGSLDQARNLRRTRLAALAALAALAMAVALPAPGAADAPPSPEVLARGEQVMRRFCLSCHGSPGGKVEDPLGPRLRPEGWADPARAYENVGALQRINRRMDQPFRGTDEERRDLAAWLAWRALENRTPAWQAALPWAAAGAGLLATVGFAVVAGRRSRRPRNGP
jgi:mono/diheme cytochrome c family protein